MSPRAEALLYAADKAQHLFAVVRPALARGAVVVCDRYVDSMLAYQGAGRVLAPAEVEQVARWATEDLRPHLTVVLDTEPGRAVHAKADQDRLEAAGDGVPRAGPAVLPRARGAGAGALPGAGRPGSRDEIAAGCARRPPPGRSRVGCRREEAERCYGRRRPIASGRRAADQGRRGALAAQP